MPTKVSDRQSAARLEFSTYRKMNKSEEIWKATETVGKGALISREKCTDSEGKWSRSVQGATQNEVTITWEATSLSKAFLILLYEVLLTCG